MIVKLIMIILKKIMKML